MKAWIWNSIQCIHILHWPWWQNEINVPVQEEYVHMANKVQGQKIQICLSIQQCCLNKGQLTSTWLITPMPGHQTRHYMLVGPVHVLSYICWEQEWIIGGATHKFILFFDGMSNHDSSLGSLWTHSYHSMSSASLLSLAHLHITT